jgi:hypothetical protein
VSKINDYLAPLESLLEQSVTEYVKLHDVLLSTQAALKEKEEEVQRLKNAIDALSGPLPVGSSDALPPTVPGPVETYIGREVEGPTCTNPSRVPEVSRKVGPKGAERGPACRGCGGEVVYTERTLSNGRSAYLWVCQDPSCNNEQF